LTYTANEIIDGVWELSYDLQYTWKEKPRFTAAKLHCISQGCDDDVGKLWQWWTDHNVSTVWQYTDTTLIVMDRLQLRHSLTTPTLLTLLSAHSLIYK